MKQTRDMRPRKLNGESALQTILEGTSGETGGQFFKALVQNLATVLDTYAAWVTEYYEERRVLNALAFWMDGKWVQNFEFEIEGTPCAAVIDSADLIHYPDNVIALYPNDPDLRQNKVVSYLGVPLLDLDGAILGHLAVMDTQALPDDPQILTIFRIFAARAAAELRRLRAEAQARERGVKLARLVETAMDAIIEMDESLHIRMVNPAAEKLLQTPGETLGCESIRKLLVEDGDHRVQSILEELAARPAGNQHLWIPSGIQLRRPDGVVFPAEATISRFEVGGRPCYTLILRNVNERMEAEKASSN